MHLEVRIITLRMEGKAMRSHPSCWNRTLTRLGFKRKRRRKKNRYTYSRRRSLFESLEQRQMLTSNTVEVDTATNVVSDDGLTSLQEAFDLVAADAQLDTITFSSDLAGETIAFPNSENISYDVTVDASSVDSITLDAEDSNRFFYVGSSGNLTLKNIELTRGNAGGGGGGAIANFGAVSLQSTVISNSNALNNSGGAIFSLGSSTLDIVDSRFYGNAAKNGGAISFTSSSQDGLAVSRSTLHANQALGSVAAGGALYLGGTSAYATIINSTFSGNSSEKWGGAIQVYGTSNVLEIVNTTIVENHSDGTVGGLRNSSSGLVRLHNTVVANNSGSYSYTVDAEGAIGGAPAEPSSHNLIGVGYSGLAIVNGDDGNQEGSITAPLDPMLLPLADVGSEKWVHPVAEGSPLIDEGSNDIAAAFALDGDQRASEDIDAPRIYNEVTDIGAIEFGSQPITVGQNFLVNEDAVLGQQRNAWVAANSFGKTAVVWEGTGPEGDGLYVQLINPDTNNPGTPRLVNYGEQGEVWNPQIAIDDAGNYAVVWGGGEDANSGVGDVFLRRYQANGTPIDVLPLEVGSHPHRIGIDDQASIVSNGSGKLLVSWKSVTGDLVFRSFGSTGLSFDQTVQVAARVADGEIAFGSSQRYAAVHSDGSFSIQ